MTLEQELKALEESLLVPAKRHDVQYLAALLHEQFEEIGSSGQRVNKADAINWLAREEDGVSWSLSEFRIKVLTDDLVMAHYKACKQAADLLSSYSLRTSLWKNESNKWRLLFHQGTTLAEK